MLGASTTFEYKLSQHTCNAVPVRRTLPVRSSKRHLVLRLLPVEVRRVPAERFAALVWVIDAVVGIVARRLAGTPSAARDNLRLREATVVLPRSAILKHAR